MSAGAIRYAVSDIGFMGSDMERNENVSSIIQFGEVVVGILRSQYTGCDYSFPDNVDFGRLYKFCEMHKVTSLVAGRVVKCDGASAEVKKLFQKQLFRCAARHTAQEEEIHALTQMFTQNNVKHCLLKGTKVSRYYPEPELRFMLDMDIYIEPSRFEQARKLMLDRGYEVISVESDKDIALSKKPFLNIDLHKELKYDYDKGYDYYKSAFSRLEGDGQTSSMNMAKEDFYVYVLSHTAHHFQTGGTGIRSIVDHFHLKNGLKPLCDPSALAEGLAQTGLDVFNGRMDELCDCWFGNAEYTPATEQMAHYIFLSGVYGTQANTYMSGVGRGEYDDKKSSYFIRRIFPPLKVMGARYPVLKKASFLLPVMWLVRILSAVFSKESFANEVKNVTSASGDDIKAHLEFLKENGL